jgi:hypothetical protein
MYNPTVRQPGEDQLNTEFDFDHYTFYDASTMYKIKYITEEYVKQGRLNTDKIRKLLIHNIYDVVMKKISKNFEINDQNKHNLDIWAKLFIRVKPIQNVVRDMTEKVEMILMKELINNRDQLKAYLGML